MDDEIIRAKRDLLDILKHIKNTTKLDSYMGICGHVSEFNNIEEHTKKYLIEKEMVNLFKQWPKYSGYVAFPIPGSRGLYNASTTYFNARKKGMFNKRHENGRLRWELLEWMIQELKRELS